MTPRLRLALLGAALALGATAIQAQSRPPVTQYPASRTNYTRANRSMIRTVVIHKAQGGNSAAWFANPRANSSAHYDVHHNGQVLQMVPEKDIAWHAGNWNTNATSIGIEHSGYAQRADTTPAQYRNSARLVAYLCVRYRIPIDRRHVIGHAEVPHPTIPGRFGGRNAHWDPGPHWNWTHFMNLVRSYANGAAPPPSPAPAASGARPTLRQGARSIQVAYLQNLLRGHGFDPGPSDGYFGPQTAAKVRAFQGSRRLVVDGVVGPQTWGALTQAAPRAAPVSTAPPPAQRPTLRFGARSIQVAYLQNKLRDRGFDPGPTDGYFGNQTLSAVRRYQSARGLVVDGVVGPQTWGSLGG